MRAPPGGFFIQLWAVMMIFTMACGPLRALAGVPEEDYALVSAASRGDLATVNALLQQTKTAPDSLSYYTFLSSCVEALTAASANGHLQVVQALVAAKVDVDGRTIPGSKIETDTPLMVASGRGHLDVVEALQAAQILRQAGGIASTTN